MKTHTTTDGQEITLGTQIHYTGDVANHAANNLTVISIEDCKWNDLKFHVVGMNEAGEQFDSVLHPTSFEPGPGRRFVTQMFLIREREEQIRSALLANAAKSW